MKLYSLDLSPFASRVRASPSFAVRTCRSRSSRRRKSDTRSRPALEVNPMGRVPVLAVGDGFALPESDTIVEDF